MMRGPESSGLFIRGPETSGLFIRGSESSGLLLRLGWVPQVGWSLKKAKIPTKSGAVWW